MDAWNDLIDRFWKISPSGVVNGLMGSIVNAVWSKAYRLTLQAGGDYLVAMLAEHFVDIAVPAAGEIGQHLVGRRHAGLG